MLSRYTAEIELDLAFHTTYRLSMFARGEEKLVTLVNLVEAFRRKRTSFLSAALITDVELYEQSVDKPEPAPTPPDHIDETAELAVLRLVSEQLQQVVHFVASQSPKAAGSPKVKRLPRPLTARDVFMRRNAVRGFAGLESKFKFVSNEEYAENVRRHREEEGGDDGQHVHSG